MSINFREKPKIYDNITGLIKLIKERECKYCELDLDKLRAIGVTYKDEKIEDGYTWNDARYYFLLDPIRLKMFEGQRLGVFEESEKSEKNEKTECDLLVFFRKFWISFGGSKYKITKKKFWSKQEISEEIDYRYVDVDSPLPNPKTDYREPRYEQIQYKQPQIEMMPHDKKVIAVYQSEFEKLVNWYESG
ncbi:hypothetical protein HOK51_09775 [Candidatus Woesearchaeota archaeon]|jgi:hypothetical protein|nr:hypothetical protein [Candidatus Woesearchaeota archaeon]MBT6520112.1 hypothetical protein [Candidatus Woesearchaeota archaeon]MBT7366717.1 hypothetical protein [Candidatus Woesearchaeota archaeon]